MTIIFPTWTNKLPGLIAAGVVVLGAFVVCFVWYYFSPWYLEVGYEPLQPVAYSHRQHAGQMGMDCRYCHTSVEIGPHANVPPTETCINCHAPGKVRSAGSLEIKKIQAAYASDMPLQWVKVNMLPDYAYFTHAAHVHAGVGCASCHGRVDQMDIVRQVEPLSMGWCLECHRDPVGHLRPPDQVTSMSYVQGDEDRQVAQQRVQSGEIKPPVHCSGCHR